VSTVQRTRRRQARDETRRQILDAAERQLRERAFRDLSVEALMADTGHSRTVFYRHFDDLADLALAVLQDVGNELYEVVQRWIATVGDGDLAARAGLSGIVEFFAREGKLVRAIAEAAHHDDEIERVYRGIVTMFSDLTEQALEQEIAAGRIAPLDPHETARAMTWMNEGYLLESFGREPPADREAVLEALSTIWRRVLYAKAS
jgi:TetR/AcrR family transcriptional regulator, ethionamide resistance regulator